MRLDKGEEKKTLLYILKLFVLILLGPFLKRTFLSPCTRFQRKKCQSQVRLQCLHRSCRMSKPSRASQPTSSVSSEGSLSPISAGSLTENRSRSPRSSRPRPILMASVYWRSQKPSQKMKVSLNAEQRMNLVLPAQKQISTSKVGLIFLLFLMFFVVFSAKGALLCVHFCSNNL